MSEETERNNRLKKRMEENRPWLPEEMDKPTFSMWLFKVLSRGLDHNAT